MTFETYGLDPLILDALRDLNYSEPRPIQKETLPIILEKKDLIALAETGSGKTAACAIPLCHQVDTTQNVIQVLIIVPTRELALQYSTETQKIGRNKQVKVFALFGGEDMELQKQKLKHGVHVLVATPGRLIDFIYARNINLTHVRTIVLDEADQMLGLGFYEDLTFIMQCLVQEHQTLLFSATMPDSIREMARHHMKEPVELSLIETDKSPASLTHQFSFCENPRHRVEELVTLLTSISPEQCLVFANSREEVEEVYRHLKRQFPSCDFLHGGLAQSLRLTITGKFSRGKIRYLVATDIAARGLDFSGVTHVFNVHFPFDQETYFHRAGRTGRSGRTGTCITLVTYRDLSSAKKLLTMLNEKGEWLKEPPKGPPPQRQRRRPPYQHAPRKPPS